MSKYMKIKGRVSKNELLNECNRVIRMQPKPEDRERIN